MTTLVKLQGPKGLGLYPKQSQDSPEHRLAKSDNVCLVAGRRRPINHLIADLNSMGNDPYQLIADILVTAGVFNVKTSDA